MKDLRWLDGIPVSAMACDRNGICVFLNDQAAQTFAKDGGHALLGQSLLDCHPEPARSRFAAQLATPRSNSYTIEKNGKKKFIHQTPWFRDGVFAGVVEMSFEIPFDLPHFTRQPS
jgi:transcriptional regulator with PAS, ATPase and Fis domain